MIPMQRTINLRHISCQWWHVDVYFKAAN